MAGQFIRQAVPKDNDCLFSCISFVADNAPEQCEGTQYTPATLRKECAEVIAKDPATYSELRLGMANDAYCTWIQNKFNWGGENEILIFTEKFNLEIAVVSTESLTCLVYGGDKTAGNRSRIYLLYTGQHYDVLCFRCEGKDQDQVLFPSGDSALEATAVEFAKVCKEEDDKKARQKTKKVIKCGGCSALLDDSQAFQEHCMTVEHDDDFCYDCSEVEVVVPENEITLDLNSPNVHTFMNMEAVPLAPSFPATFTVNDKSYQSFERYFQAVRFETSDNDTASAIRSAKTSNEALVIASNGTTRPDWEQRRVELAKIGFLALYSQNKSLLERLVETGDKTIVYVGTDKWAGMDATGGVPVGRNTFGNILMEVREELKGTL